MVGGEHDDDLHVTRDGAKSWQTISMPAPKELSPAKFANADVPVFEDSKHGFVAVTYTGGRQSAAVLFVTDDGGRSWKQDRVLSNLEETSEGHEVKSAVVGDIWLIAKVSNHRPILTALRAGARMQATIDPASHLSGYFGANQMSFVTPTQGSVLRRRRIALDHRRRRHLDRHHSEVIRDSSFLRSVAFFDRSKYTTAFRCPGPSSS